MRLWTLHPKYLDSKGLVALWREALLARAVLRGRTRGYRSHPQLSRFREHSRPLGAINRYLDTVYLEAERRGYEFDRRKLGRATVSGRIGVSTGQVEFEWTHLLDKLKTRHPARFDELISVERPAVHPLFRIVPGSVHEWERGAGRG